MQHLIQTLRALPIPFDIHAAEPPDMAQASDRDLVRAVGLAIARPKLDRFSSFILHAPLELLARAALLPLVERRHRSAARMRIASIAALYAQGDELEPVMLAFRDVDQAQSALETALRDGDPDTADAAVTFIAERIPCDAICAVLTDLIVDRLAAAAHAPLLLVALRDAEPTFGNLSILLRASVRMMAGRPDLRLSWIDEPIDSAGPEDLRTALDDLPHVAVSSDSIAPTMLAVEANGLAARLLGNAAMRSGEDAPRLLARIAAHSMIEGDAAHAPYGWTHCLTLPQGVLALRLYSADRDRLTRIAATFVLGFRATLGSTRLGEDPPHDISPAISDLVGYAAMHEDAHLAKYVVACLNAAAADPQAKSLFEAAAHHLANWWRLQSVG